MSDALRSRLSALVRDSGRALGRASETVVRVGDAVAESAGEWTTRLGALRDAQRVRESQRRASERALPGEEVAAGVRVVRSVEAARMRDSGGGSVGGASAPMLFAKGIGAEAPPTVTPAVGAFVSPCPVWERDAATGPLLFLDTETTGLSGGTGTLVFMLGLARFRDDGTLEAEQWLLTRPSGEAAMLDAIAATVPRNATLVSFNGKAFDAPLIAARHALHRRRDPFARCGHWDLLAPTRRAFETRWPDCRLQTAERRLLGIERVDDLPGAFAPAAFTTLLRTGDAALMRRVLDHNRQDLYSLAHLLAALERVFAEPGAFDADAASIGRRLVANDRLDDAERALAGAAETQHDARRELARLARRRGRIDEAVELWRPLAVAGCAHAIEALAKIEEHRRRDYAAALAHARQLVALEPAEPRHRQRLARLVIRAGRRDAAC